MIRQQLLDIAAGQFRGREQRFPKEVTLSEDDVKDLIEVGMDIPENGKKTIWASKWVQHNYGLDDIIWRAAGRRLDKGADSWRLRYAKLTDVPLEQWPPEAIAYPLEDARATLDIYLAQEVHKEFIEDQFRQTRAAWALFLTQTWGLRTHGPGVDALERETIAALGEIEDGLKEAGLVRTGERVVVLGADGQPKTMKDGRVRTRSGGKPGSRDTKVAKRRMIEVCQRQGKPVRLTDKGGICLDSEACESSGDEILEDYAQLTSLKAVLNKDLPMLRNGIYYPVHTSFGMAASCRVTSSKPNVQNPKRLPGIRECFIPRPGKVFAQADFAALELHTLAQCCLVLVGQSELANVLNAGMDPHTDFACSLLRISYEEGLVRRKNAKDDVFDNARQTAKVANFGFGGGLGAEKLCLFAKKSYNQILTVDRAKDLKESWLQRWPEMRFYFRLVSDLIDAGTGLATIRQVFSNRFRGGCHYTSACNGFFQSLGADAAKRATYLVSKACYAEPESALYGSRIVNMIHDELLVEVDDDYFAHDKALELSRLMILGANEFLPDVPARAEPQLAKCWSKKSKPVFVDGRLVPWSQ
jgi:hypothetical protein